MKIPRQFFLFLWLALSSTLALCVEPVSERAWVEDVSGSMSLEQVKATPQKPLTGPYFGQGFSDSVFWIRLRLDPSLWPEAKPETEVVIRLRPVNTDEFQLHDPLATGGEIRFTGDKHPWSQDDYQSLNNNFVVPLGAEPRDIWLRLKTSTSTFSSIELLNVKTVRAKDMRQLVSGLLYLSVLMICMGWGVLSWMSWRDKLLGLYVFREMILIMVSMITMGWWRVLGAPILPPYWIDTIGTLGFFVAGAVALWFDIHFLREFKPTPHMIKILYGFLIVFCVTLVAAIFGHVGWAFRAYAAAVTLSFITVFLTAATSRIWTDCPPHTRPLLSKKLLVGFYFSVLLIVVFNRLVVMGVISFAVDVWNLLYLYPLTVSLMMMAVLQFRARQQYKAQQQAELRIALAEHSAQQEKSKRQEQQQFLAMLGHELRNPLSAVNFLADGSTQEGQKIRRAVQDMNLVLERSIQAERLEDAGFEARTETINLAALLQELAARASIERVQVQAEALPESLESDKLLLSTVLGNLLDNALKYSPEDSVVTLEAEWISHETGNSLRFRIANTAGPAGVPEEEKLFEKYYRNPAAHHQVGSGLGLYLVKGLIKRLGGHITYRAPTVGDGQRVVFEVSVPMALPATP